MFCFRYFKLALPNAYLSIMHINAVMELNQEVEDLKKQLLFE